MADAPMVASTRGLIAGLAVVFWAFATWLIPVLVAAGWWRHVRRGVPLTYDATLWSLVFPLGMYAVAGIYLGRADHLPVVEAVGRTELWVALTVWLVVFVAMARHVVNTVFRPGLGSGQGSTSAATRPTLGGRTTT
jgi:tellurite resistance protein TehA-like permease